MDNFLIIQIYMLFFFMFAIHVYFLFNKLFVKEKKVILNDSNILWILLGLFIITIVFGLFYKEFLLNSNLENTNIKDSIANWGAFGSYFGGFVAPILTFITLIILIKQISISREANNLQIEHLNKTRRIEILVNLINELANKTELAIEKQVPLTEELVNIYLKNYDDERSKNLTIKSFENNYKEKIFKVNYSDAKTVDEFDWINSITYLRMINKKYEEKAKDNLDDFLRIECHNISVLIKKLIALCTELSNLDENSYQIIKFSLITFTESVEELKKVDLIEEKTYELFFQLICIHNNNEDSIEEDLKKLFAKEISNKYEKNLTENDLSTINFEFVNKNKFKVGQFSTEINGTTYFRINGNWLNGEEILKRRMDNNIS
ncbi:hypothetical protein PJV94_10570 [Aliarcobacter butzleri]|uniref:hypothetical protein n=1 Tax=Aliarcobacter butzleri TaxID=28197 RepID=UPI00263D976C|nr:hypothetical protein [Aliarcobacter butzleri]MDN5073583.1 hypothetical protein [Aliarcobacter butzleri]MDN5122120.1 hypothetical protein [Aliarcobacter butzleri]